MGAGRIARLIALMVGLCVGPMPVLAGGSARDDEASAGAGRADPDRDSRARAIDWSAPAGCPDRAWIVATIERHQGGPLRMPWGFSARVEVVRHGARQWHMTLRIRSADVAGERVVEGGSCQEIAQAAALLIVLALDGARDRVPAPSRAIGGPVPGRAVPLELWPLPSVAEPPVPRERQRPGAPARSRAARAAGLPMEWRVRSSVVYGAMALPGGGFGVGAGAALVRDRLRIDLSGAHWFERTGTVEGEPMAGGSFHLEVATLRTCWRISKYIGAGCVGGELGLMRAAGFGVEQENAVRELWAAPMASLVGDYRLTESLRISAIADHGWALRRPRFTLSGLGQVHQPGRSALRFYLGVEARFR